MDGHYDREADIAWLRVEGWAPERMRVEQQPQGLIERSRDDERVLGLEYWKANEHLPAELLDALPAPTACGIVVIAREDNPSAERRDGS